MATDNWQADAHYKEGNLVRIRQKFRLANKKDGAWRPLLVGICPQLLAVPGRRKAPLASDNDRSLDASVI
jgi:hypothetical protein